MSKLGDTITSLVELLKYIYIDPPVISREPKAFALGVTCISLLNSEAPATLQAIGR
jgi:hypothetical protein